MTGRYKAYSEYKDSGVDWLHDIPSHWKTIPIGRCYHRVKRTGYESEELLSVYRDHGVIPKSSRDDNNNKASDDLSPYQLVCENNLVMNKMKAWQGSIAISEHRGIVSPAYFVYEPFKHTESMVYPKYVHYLLRHPIYITQYMSRSKGIRVNQWDLDPESFQSIELLLPLKEEQQKIIRFLDHETAKIDTLITKQEKLIELLKEKRQAVISHAVTKGLNPDAPMKDSGVEWLGEVPEHWVVSKFAYLKTILTDYTANGSFADLKANVEYKDTPSFARLVRLTDLRVDLKNDNGVWIDECSYKFLRKSALYGGEFLLANVGAYAGLFYQMPFDKGAASLAPNMFMAKFNVNKVLREFMAYVGQADGISSQLKLSATASSAQPKLNKDDFKSVRFTYPDIMEQNEIVKRLDKELPKIDKLIIKQQQAIELMKERKTALISAAVTGKIDVRNWQGEA
ncbi:restriction endonuclease subunit S [Vibrio owensii]|uniref:restriction endonuclease subunit S n=1 Tax=Vibrio owensii TaxID=696485 RepID=UPI00215C19CA|nr:restriction endonuclease subunit S [Vibrio owensii]MCR9942277.1 restriction endonuclease subunit S [Vibrio owensii]